MPLCFSGRWGLFDAYVYYYFDEVTFSQYPIKNKIFNETNLPVFIFDIIRDIYHDHVHHGKDDDCTLAPVIASNKKEAINLLLKQYQNKIIDYHKDFKPVKNFIAKFLYWKRRMYFLASGCGEFTYAKSFISLHKNILNEMGQDIDTLEKSFELASNSVLTLKEKYSWLIMYVISILAIVIAFFGLISMFEPISNIYNNFFPPTTVEEQQEASKNQVGSLLTKKNV